MRVHGIDEVPGGEIEIDFARYAPPLRPQRAVAQLRHDRGKVHRLIEVGTGHVHAVIGEDVVLPRQVAVAGGAHAHQREIRSAAADIGDQHQLFIGDGGFVIERRSDGFELKRNFGKARRMRRQFQRGNGLRVARGVAIDEMHRPTDDDAIEFATVLRLGDALQVAQIADDDIDVLDRDAVADFRNLLHQIRAENTFDRAHQPAIVAIDVRGNGFAPKTARIVFGVIENGRRHALKTRLQFDEPHTALVRNGDGGIGRAEVDGTVVVEGHGDCARSKGMRLARLKLRTPGMKGRRIIARTLRRAKRLPQCGTRPGLFVLMSRDHPLESFHAHHNFTEHTLRKISCRDGVVYRRP